MPSTPGGAIEARAHLLVCGVTAEGWGEKRGRGSRPLASCQARSAAARWRGGRGEAGGGGSFSEVCTAGWLTTSRECPASAKLACASAR
jgi:hypothetical protein